MQNRENNSTNCKRLIIWLVSLLIALYPVILCFLGELLYSDNPEAKIHYHNYLIDFIGSGSGSLLWIGITLLAAALYELFMVNDQHRSYKNSEYVFLSVAIFLVIIGFVVFSENVFLQISFPIMVFVSVFALVLFSIFYWS